MVELKAKIEQMRELYKGMLKGKDELWEEYVRLLKRVSKIVTEKKIQIWNEVVDKAKRVITKSFGHLLVGGQKARREL